MTIDEEEKMRRYLEKIDKSILIELYLQKCFDFEIETKIFQLTGKID